MFNFGNIFHKTIQTFPRNVFLIDYRGYQTIPLKLLGLTQGPAGVKDGNDAVCRYSTTGSDSTPWLSEVKTAVL